MSSTRAGVGAIFCACAVGVSVGMYSYGGTVYAPPVVAILPKNQAFVFVKPHAATDKVTNFVKKELEAKGLKVLSEGEIKSDEIDQKKLIDQHYYSIASKATILKPEALNVSSDKFKAAFGVEWSDALNKKQVFNALDACTELKITPEQMNSIWADASKANKLVKFGGGFYCGQVTYKKRSLYVFNGFFMEMRNAFTAPGKKIHYYTVEWEEADLPWADFRGKVLGPTDPKSAPVDSLRGSILKSWKDMGLKSEPNVGYNAVHGSASPFEAMAERMNWLGFDCPRDSFCTALVKAGVPHETIKKWSLDPQVVVDNTGKKGSVFDALEDLGTAATVQKVKLLSTLQQASPK